MIIGDINRFAIEFIIDDEPFGRWLYGQSCFWIEGRRVGNYDVITPLGDVFTKIHGVVKECGKRHSDWINRDKKEIFDYFNDILYINFYNDDQYDVEMPARFHISIGTESFFGIKIFLLDCDILTSRLIYLEDDGITVNEIKLVPGEFDSVLKRFYIELEKLDKKTRNCD